ncbi:MAG: isochorismatase family protein [Rhodospirillaceae bacterium]|nr:isochorismatase family protein [Rhodospirillaceae bacterium]
MTDASSETYVDRTYGAAGIGYGDRPGIVVVDFQTAFTDAQYALGGAPLIQRAVGNTARLLDVARRADVPVASCYTAYSATGRDRPYWKVQAVIEDLVHGHPSTQLDPRIHDPSYDVAFCKSGASIFFQTPLVALFAKERVDTVIVTGCVTSGCVRASAVDSFQWGFRTIVPEDCVGDHHEAPHRDNLRDIGRRYCDITDADSTIGWLEAWRGRNRHEPK